MTAVYVPPFPAIIACRRRVCYHPNLKALHNKIIHGVYVIIDAQDGSTLYVGESHTGRLYDTITRHFRAWRIDPAQDAQGRRRGGTTYDRRGVDVGYWITSTGAEAQTLQAEKIVELAPRDNAVFNWNT